MRVETERSAGFGWDSSVAIPGGKRGLRENRLAIGRIQIGKGMGVRRIQSLKLNTMLKLVWSSLSIALSILGQDGKLNSENLVELFS